MPSTIISRFDNAQREFFNEMRKIETDEPVPAAPDEFDRACANHETLLAIKAAKAYMTRLYDRLESIKNGTIPPMPQIQRPLPDFLRNKRND